MWILLLHFGLSYLFLRAILKDLISVCKAIMFLISRINKVRRNMKFFQSFFQKTRHSSQFLKEYLLWKFWNIPREINTVGLIFHKVTGATLLFPKHLLRWRKSGYSEKYEEMARISLTSLKIPKWISKKKLSSV